MPPHQTSTVTRVLGPNQLIRASGGREHTVLRVLRPRKKFVLLPFSFWILYNTINSRRKEALRKRIICKALVPGREEEIHIGLRIQN